MNGRTLKERLRYLLPLAITPMLLGWSALAQNAGVKQETSARAGARAAAGQEQTEASAHADMRSASTAKAELVKGKLNPEKSKPGDRVVLKLKEDLKSEGEVLMRKGDTMEGVIKSVKRKEEGKAGAKGEAKGEALSMVQVEWLAPTLQGQVAQSLAFTVQAVTQISPIFLHNQAGSLFEQDVFGDASARGRHSTMTSGVPAVSSAQGSLGSSAGATAQSTAGVLGGVVETTGAVTGTVAQSTETAVSGVGQVSGAAVGATAQTTAEAGAQVEKSVAATAGGANLQGAGAAENQFLFRPLAIDARTASMLKENLALSTSGEDFFQVGRGMIITANGTRHSLDVFSSFSNDMVLVSSAKNFEISSGAEMQLLATGKSR